MVTDRRKKLSALGAGVLADALMDLAERVEVVDDLVERLIATPKENIQRYKKKLADLKRRQRFISWKESTAFAHELEMLLADLESGVDDPRPTRFRSRAPKARCGQPGNPLPLNHSGPFILGRAQGALDLIADVARIAHRYHLLPGFSESRKLS